MQGLADLGSLFFWVPGLSPCLSVLSNNSLDLVGMIPKLKAYWACGGSSWVTRVNTVILWLMQGIICFSERCGLVLQLGTPRSNGLHIDIHCETHCHISINHYNFGCPSCNDQPILVMTIHKYMSMSGTNLSVRCHQRKPTGGRCSVRSSPVCSVPKNPFDRQGPGRALGWWYCESTVAFKTWPCRPESKPRREEMWKQRALRERRVPGCHFNPITIP